MCGSSKIHPDRYEAVQPGTKLGKRDGCIVYSSLICILCCMLMPVCVLVCSPIIYYIRIVVGDSTIPSLSPTLQPTPQPLPLIDLNDVILTNLTNLTY